MMKPLTISTAYVVATLAVGLLGLTDASPTRLRSGGAGTDDGPKRGLSGLAGCGDATALGLENSWHYNWGLWPTTVSSDGTDYPDGTVTCPKPVATEFVPMFWGCHSGAGASAPPHGSRSSNCVEDAVWAHVHDDWAKVGVRYILGFNEPDNPGQSNISAADAAYRWAELDDFAS